MIQRLRDLTAAGSGGSAVACVAWVVPVVPTGWADPNAAARTAMSVTPAVARTSLIIQPLLLR